MINIQIFGQVELENHIKKGGNVYSHLISIGNPGRGKRGIPDHVVPDLFRTSFQSILRLEFYDAEDKSFLGPLRPKRIPQKRDVRRVVRYFEKTKHRADGYTIHCWRGRIRISDSAKLGAEDQLDISR
jgi:predicted protein tyrosine phosphatase